jgi:hypothetical protein
MTRGPLWRGMEAKGRVFKGGRRDYPQAELSGYYHAESNPGSSTNIQYTPNSPAGPRDSHLLCVN